MANNQQNPLRTESPTTAAEIDDRILDAWEQHPRRYLIEPARDFLDKAARALEILPRRDAVLLRSSPPADPARSGHRRIVGAALTC
jgi:hypothetical protein